MKRKRKNTVLEQVKAARKQSREEEIQRHGKSINYRKVMESKRLYNRKKNKADDEVQPYFFFQLHGNYQIETLFSAGTKSLFVEPIPNALYHA